MAASEGGEHSRSPHGGEDAVAAHQAAGPEAPAGPARAAAKAKARAMLTSRSGVEHRTGRADGGDGSRRGEGLASPHVRFSMCLKRVKGEDAVFIREGRLQRRDGPTWSLFCLADGHNGTEASQYIKARMWGVLAPTLPKGRPPKGYGRDFRRFSMKVSQAVTAAFLEMGEQFKAHCASNGNNGSGATVTLALLCGRLLTIANVGDSKAVLDTGKQSLLATVSHRLEDSKGERRRLSDAGVALTPGRSPEPGPGPEGHREGGPDVLRCYPGGLPFSRSIGDAEAGRHIVPCPHICQVVVPEKGVRLVIGSSGLWSNIRWSRVMDAVRNSHIKAAASLAINAAAQRAGKRGGLQDASVLVLDIDGPKPQAETDGREGDGATGCWGELAACLCCRSGPRVVDDLDMTKDHLMVVARVDGLDISKASAAQRDARPSCLRCGCLPWHTTPFDGAAGTPGEWAPTFLTAKRAALGSPSAESAWAPVGMSAGHARQGLTGCFNFCS